jgi:hypothetical protein
VAPSRWRGRFPTHKAPSRAPKSGRAPDASHPDQLLLLGAIDAGLLFDLSTAGRYDQSMPRLPADLPPESAVMLTNPDEDCSADAFRAFLDELLDGPEPELNSVDAVDAVRALRVDAQA